MDSDNRQPRQGPRNKTLDKDEARRNREETTISLRKEKRAEQLDKKRNMSGATAVSSHTLPNVGSQAWLEANPAQLVEGVNSDDPNHQLPAVTQFRKLLSIERSPPIAEVIAAGVVPRFVQFLQCADNPMLQFEAAWALTNIASGTSEHTRMVIANGAVPIFVQLLMSPNDDVREQAVWALGNIAGDSPECRDLVLGHHVLPPLLEQLNPQSKMSMLRNATWTLSNMCRGKPQPAWHMVAPALPVLAQLVFSNDDEVLADGCWALSYLSDGSNEKIQAVLDTGICARIVELMGHPPASVQTPALRTAGNIVTGDDHQTQCVINCGALPRLLALVRTYPYALALQGSGGGGLPHVAPPPPLSRGCGAPTCPWVPGPNRPPPGLSPPPRSLRFRDLIPPPPSIPCQSLVLTPPPPSIPCQSLVLGAAQLAQEGHSQGGVLDDFEHHGWDARADPSGHRGEHHPAARAPPRHR